jgi:T5SS/PEP-CTERM-associated repeat protein
LTGEFSAFGGDFYVYDHTVVEIMNGSSLNDFKATVNGSDTLVHVHGAGSRWSTSEASDYPNSGVLRIDGTLQITNAGTVTASYYMMIGAGSEGIVEISSGGQLITENAAIGQFGGSLGTVTVDGTGSNWNNFATLQVAVDGAGTLSVMNGGAITTVSLQVGTLGEVSGDGSIIGLVQNGGLVSPGTSSGTLTIDGDYAQSAAGELLIELASAVSYDQLQITSIQHPPPSIATLDGTLTVEPLDGFTPSAGQSFTILTADFVTGTFGTEVFPSMPNLAFDVLYNPQSVVLTVLSALPGDYSGNGTVDAADYTVWRNSVGGVSLPNEGASLGTVDDLDYDFWKLHFGETIGSGSGSADFGELSRAGASPSQAAVPEPAALSLMFAALIGAVINRAAPRPGSRR